MRTQQRAHPRHQFLHAERLGHVVVGAGIERGDFLAFVGAHGQHDHRHLRPLAQARQHLMAVEVGQAEVEDHQVGAMRRHAPAGRPRRPPRFPPDSPARAG
jgi:hypothetical protein